MSYTFDTTLDMPFEAAVAHVTEGLKAKGFGVLTTIDVKATLKAKIDADFRPYTILGACNPKLAHQALQAEPFIGAMLPCNVVVQAAEGGGVTVSAIDPVASMAAVENDSLGAIATQVRGLLQAVILDLTDLILFVHGLACAGASFDGAGAYPALGETWAPDLPGHGGRPVPEGCDGTMEALAEDLRAGLAARDYHRLHLVAHSMGAAPALLLADRGAEIRLASFVNIEGNLIGADCSLLSRRASAMPPRDFRAIHWPKLVTAASEARDPAVRTWAGWMAQADPAAVHAACGSLVAWSDGGELLARYRALAVPKVYVHGGTSALPEVLAALEGTPVQAFDGAGHFVPTAAPDRFYPWLADWLARLPKVQ